MRLRVHNKISLIILVLMFMGVGVINASTIKDIRTKEQLSGGEGTVFDTTNQAFTLPLANLPIEQLRDFTFGNRMFNTNWVVAPSSTKKFDGLGPVFNRISCSACHTFDGRGRPPAAHEKMESMLVRISVPGQGDHGGVKAHPVYGDQINDRAIPGIPPEGDVDISYSLVKGYYPDGTMYELRVPSYAFKNLAYGPIGEDVLFSPRVAPAVFGLGLLESVDEQTILGFAKQQENHPDHVSGRPNYVWDVRLKKTVLGRFGWKANQPNLAQQDAGAFVGDIGITNPIFPDENITPSQEKANKAPNGGKPELEPAFFEKLTFYSRTLAVPARRNVNDKQVRLGEKEFKRIGCAVCHIPSMTTGINKEIPALSNQEIQPFTDLLLHDMGDGLADGRPDFQASGHQWRTPPLWGIGLVKNVNKHTFFMHDGRARNFEEAILWHGGEAELSKKRFKQLTKVKREAVIKFLESL